MCSWSFSLLVCSFCLTHSAGQSSHELQSRPEDSNSSIHEVIPLPQALRGETAFMSLRLHHWNTQPTLKTHMLNEHCTYAHWGKLGAVRKCPAWLPLLLRFKTLISPNNMTDLQPLKIRHVISKSDDPCTPDTRVRNKAVLLLYRWDPNIQI